MEDERIIFHNGTDRPEVMIAVAEAAAEVIGNMRLSESVRRNIAIKITCNLHYGSMPKTERQEEKNNG